MRAVVKKITTIIACFLAGLCAVSSHAQNNQQTSGNLPEQWFSDENFQQTLPIADQWWAPFGDPLLDSLIASAVAGNYDLLIAANRMDAAKARMRIQQGAFYPQISADVSYSPQSITVLGVDNVSTRMGRVGLDMSWEVDIVGSVRQRAKSQKELFIASQEDYKGIMASLRAQVASAYVTLRMYQQQLGVAQRNLSAQESTVKLTEARFKSGLVSALDVAQAKTIYNSTKASIPGIEANILSQINILGILLGDVPWRLRERLQTLPENFKLEKPLLIAVGLPADLIRQRPDIRSAESRLNAQASALGATKADWYPKLYINGSVGYVSKNFEQLFQPDHLNWQIAPSMKWTLFAGRQLQENTKLAREQLDQSINHYNQIILSALQETDDAMNAYNQSLKQIAATDEACKQAQITVDLSLDLYKRGLVNFQNVLDAQRYLLIYENEKVTAESASLLYLISLYRALGINTQ